MSAVAADDRNKGLMRSLCSSGLPDVRTGWAAMFHGEARFAVFSHQAWWSWVAQADDAPSWAADWLSWVGERYGYGHTPGGEGA